MTRLAAASLAACLPLLAVPAHAAPQIHLSNLAELRRGHDPDFTLAGLDPHRRTAFEQLSADIWSSPLRAGVRFETYRASDERRLNFSKIVQRYAELSTDRLQARLGNFDAIFGRGLVLRAYQLPGVVREEFGTPQFGDLRDLDGGSVRLFMSRFELAMLSGRPRRPDLDPGHERRGRIDGAAVTAEVASGVRLGADVVRRDPQSGEGSTEAPGAFLQLGLEPWLERAGFRHVGLDTYVEAARTTASALRPQGHGLYASQAMWFEAPRAGLRWGVSYEYKDYWNFDLGANEPPTLVREHSYALLNRTTHVLRLQQERGHQVESRLSFRERGELTLSWSQAENVESRQFRELYAELTGHARGGAMSLFADAARDESESIGRRRTFGVYTLAPLGGPRSLELEVEQQGSRQVLRQSSLDFTDRHASLTFAWAGRFSLAVVRQTTDDPDEVQNSSGRRAFDSLGGSVRLGDHHTMLLFWGRRRGGLACTAGTCYTVRSFDGASIDLVSRF